MNCLYLENQATQLSKLKFQEEKVKLRSVWRLKKIQFNIHAFFKTFSKIMIDKFLEYAKVFIDAMSFKKEQFSECEWTHLTKAFWSKKHWGIENQKNKEYIFKMNTLFFLKKVYFTKIFNVKIKKDAIQSKITEICDSIWEKLLSENLTFYGYSEKWNDNEKKSEIAIQKRM
jgi:hypothetical protein